MGRPLTIKKIIDFLRLGIWRIRLKELPRKKSFLIRQLRIILLAIRGFDEDRCGLRASALTFYSLLSVVPAAAMAFGVAKGFGLQRLLEKELFEKLKGQEEVITWIITFANSMLGLPGSTLEDDLSNVELSFELSPTYASFTVFMPFPGTELYRTCEENKELAESLSYESSDFPTSMFQASLLKSVTEERKRIHHNIMMLAALANWKPALRRLVMRRLIYRKPNRFFWLMG